jgi:NAD(P)-dependent dehydrogenase (short-subunit alcohol dehydrogenase family)
VTITARKADELAAAADELARTVAGGADRVLAVPGNAREGAACRRGRPDSGAVTFLASDAACWVTGETVRVDGGLLATGPLR